MAPVQEIRFDGQNPVRAKAFGSSLYCPAWHRNCKWRTGNLDQREKSEWENSACGNLLPTQRVFTLLLKEKEIINKIIPGD